MLAGRAIDPDSMLRCYGFFVFQCLGLVAAIAWLLFDPMAVQVLDHAMSDSGSALQVFSGLDLYRSIGLGVLGLLLVVSLAWELSKVMRRSRNRLTVRRLAFSTLIVACWLNIGMNYQRITWRGKQLRSRQRVSNLHELAIRLHEQWPVDAGEIDGVGPFTVYPFDRPQLLLLLTPRPVGETKTVITAIEKSEASSLRFELGGVDGGDWIEWHPDGYQPTDFIGGLEDQHQLQEFAMLQDNWYLVRYSLNGFESSKL